MKEEKVGESLLRSIFAKEEISASHSSSLNLVGYSKSVFLLVRPKGSFFIIKNQRENMRDQTIRQLLRRTELSKYLNDPNSKVVEELKLPVAGARVDIAVINGSLHGFEIKSAVDTLKRLPLQLDAYSKVFDFLSIITEGKHYEKILAFLPNWIGLYLCEEIKGQEFITEIQKPQKNSLQEGFYIAKLLWRDEIMSILEQYKIPHKKKDRNWIQCETLANNIDVEVLSELVRQKLKKRPANWKTKEDYVEKSYDDFD